MTQVILSLSCVNLLFLCYLQKIVTLTVQKFLGTPISYAEGGEQQIRRLSHPSYCHSFLSIYTSLDSALDDFQRSITVALHDVLNKAPGCLPIHTIQDELVLTCVFSIDLVFYLNHPFVLSDIVDDQCMVSLE